MVGMRLTEGRMPNFKVRRAALQLAAVSAPPGSYPTEIIDRARTFEAYLGEGPVFTDAKQGIHPRAPSRSDAEGY